MFIIYYYTNVINVILLIILLIKLQSFYNLSNKEIKWNWINQDQIIFANDICDDLEKKYIFSR